MKRKTAYKIALDSMDEKRKKDAVNHNSYLRYGDTFEFMVHGHKRYIRITEAMKVIENEMEHKQLELL